MRAARSMGGRCGLVALALLVALGLASPAGAKTFEVTRTDDPAPNGCKQRNCSVREAVRAANNRSGLDIVQLKGGKVYILSRAGTPFEDNALDGDLDVVANQPLIIKSTKRKRATINANGTDTVLHAFAPLTLDGVELKNGESVSASTAGGIEAGNDTAGPLTLKDSAVLGCEGTNAGGIDLQAGQLRLVKSEVKNNEGLGDAGGIDTDELIMARSTLANNTGTDSGGFDASGDIKLVRSVVKGNATSSDDVGGEADQDAVVKKTKFIDNVAPVGTGDAGGLDVGGHLVMSKSLVARNSGNDDGGLEVGSAEITDSRIIDNRSTAPGGGGDAGGMQVFADVTMTRTTVAGNIGDDEGGLDLSPDAASSVVNSTISGNHSTGDEGGIGISGTGQMTIANTTVAGNSADGNGGGLSATSSSNVTLNNVTVARNTADMDDAGGGLGGGIFNEGGTFEVENSVIALNDVGTSGSDADCSGTFISDDANLRSVADAGCIGFVGPTDLVDASPGLAQLGDYGGPTETIRLQASSPAVGLGGPDTTTRDQRGVLRDANPDSGAYER